MPLLNDKATTLLATVAAVNMQTGTRALYTTPVGKTTVIARITVRNASATLAGSTVNQVTGWLTGFSLASLITASTGAVIITMTNNVQFTPIAAATAVQLIIGTGSTGAATATIDIFGYTF